MKLNLYEIKNVSDEHTDIYYAGMRPVIKQLIDTAKSERPVLQGRPADEDQDDGMEVILDPSDIYEAKQQSTTSIGAAAPHGCG